MLRINGRSFQNIKQKYKVLVHYLRVLGQKLRLTGARERDSSENDLVTLVLNKSYPLGAKGSHIHLPEDKIIYEFIKLRGSWELEESTFLAEELRMLCSIENQEGVALIDIGANTGLVTLQAMNLAGTGNDCILIEPAASHVAAIRKNFSNSNFEVMVKEFALGDHDGQGELFKQKSNRGNSSLVENVVPKNDKISEFVEIRDSKNFFEREIDLYDSFVLKCDTQGYDALILSRIPSSAWSKIKSAVIEVWALPVIDPLHVKELLSKIESFSDVSWNAEFNIKVDFEDVLSFWLSKTSESRNLFIRR
jgi:FkbM family methyltransferase